MAKAIIFDLDGVVYRGRHGIPGVAGAIAKLQRRTKVLFLTNNATKSRPDYVIALAKFGIFASQDDVMTSSFGCAHYIRKKYGAGRKVFAIGERGLEDELENEAKAKLVESGAKIVVVGLDRGINYHKLDCGLRNLQAGAAFVLANSDPTYLAEKGFSPGSGAIAAALIYASGKEPDFVVGKPSYYLMEKLLSMHRVNPKDAIFVGDRLDIDIRMANEMGMKSVLVLTGVAKEGDVKNAQRGDRPDIVMKSAANIESVL